MMVGAIVVGGISVGFCMQLEMRIGVSVMAAIAAVGGLLGAVAGLVVVTIYLGVRAAARKRSLQRPDSRAEGS
jgi:hypothetical protein